MIRQSGTNQPARQSSDVPVFEIDPGLALTYPNGDTLPGVWVTAPAEDGAENGTRQSVTWYPGISYDEEGEDALYYGGSYYEEGMGCIDPADHERRIQCFQAAELLYRHSAGRGNAVANLCLGYVYSYDRCEGHYWMSSANASADTARPYPRAERAFECLSVAAKAGIPEACYKLGDMYKQGTGCDPDAGAAFRWYKRASELSVHERPVILGSIALRLADCYEEGFGCEQDFNRALRWYDQAVVGLEAAVDMGEAWYAKALANARAGQKRCQQEIAFQA